jgi:D-alanine transaminase/branched-chain amino acid aminotransferase
MHTFGYLNGKVVRTDAPQLFLDDIGLLRGFASFDFFRIYNSVPLDLNDHYKRFLNSSKMLGLKVPVSQRELEEILATLLKKNKISYAHVRVILTGGKTKEGLLPTTPNFFVLLEPMHDLPVTLYAKGGTLLTFEHLRPFAEAKTTNYQQAVVLQPLKKKAGAVEILYTYKGNVLEATTSNVCMVRGKTVVTPKADILAGITRKVVLELAKKAGYKVVERDIKVKELLAADEVFLTATNKKVLPIVRIDKVVIGNGKVGPVSRELNELYAEHIRRSCGL